MPPGARGRWSALLAALLGVAAAGPPAPLALAAWPGRRRRPRPRTTAAGPENLTRLLEEARDGDVLLLATREGPYAVSETLKITRALTLRPRLYGERAVFNGQGKTRVFRVLADATLEDIDIVNGSADEGGGVVVGPRARPSFLGCRFEDNVADLQGGAMQVSWAAAPTLQRCTFRDNKARYYAGGLYVNGSGTDPVLLNVIFERNFAGSRAGALLVFGQAAPRLEACTFRGNSAGAFGGGLLVEDWGTEPTLVNVSFVGNSAVSHAGALLVKGKAAPRFEACTFLGNWAGLTGGALFVEEAFTQPVFVKSVFKYNSVEEPEASGGAFCVTRGAAPRFESCAFKSNTGWRAGGGLVDQMQTRPEFLDVAFNDNTAIGDSGGALVVKNGATPHLEGCTFRHNEAKGSGGGLYVKDQSMEPALLRNVTFVGNSADQDGGAILVSLGAAPRLEACTFRDNRAERLGGALCAVDAGTAPVLLNATLVDNKAGQGGGALVIIFGATPRLEACVIRGNRAGTTGGGLFVWGTGTMPKLVDVTLVGNRAAVGGGALCAMSGATPLLTACTLRGNSAAWGGGLMVEGNGIHYGESGTRPVLKRVAVVGNRATHDHGGGILVRSGATIRLEACTLKDNWAKKSGGGLFVEASDAESEALLKSTLLRVDFVGNSAVRNGGALLVRSGAAPILWDCTFLKNRATRSGGGLSVEGRGTEPALWNVTFVGNFAGTNGGGLLVSAGATARLGGAVRLQDNRAGWAGGGACFEDGGAAVELSAPPTVWRPPASGAAGPLRLSLLGNSASFGGGAFVPLATRLCELLCTGTIADNDASVAGGGAFVRLDLRQELTSSDCDCLRALRAAPWGGNEAPRGPGLASSALSVRLLSTSEAPVARFNITAELIDAYGDVVIEENDAVVAFSSELVRWDQRAAALALARLSLKERAEADLVHRECISKDPEPLACAAVKGGRANSSSAAFLPAAPVRATFPFEMQAHWRDALTGLVNTSVSVVGRGVVTVTTDCPPHASVLPDDGARQRGENFSCPWVECERGHFFYTELGDSTGTDLNDRTGECRLCRDVHGADCPGGAVGIGNLRLKQHHWRFSLTTLHIVDCRASREESREDEWSACEGGTGGGGPDSYCSEGHAGPKCRLCQESPRHYRSGRSCLPCKQGGLAERAALAVFAVCLLLASAVAFRRARRWAWKKARLPAEVTVARRMAYGSVSMAYRAYQFIGLLGRLKSKSTVPRRLQPLRILNVDLRTVLSLVQADCQLGFAAAQRALLVMNLVAPALAVASTCALIWGVARRDPYRCKFLLAKVAPPVAKLVLVGGCLAVSRMVTCDADLGDGEGTRLAALSVVRCGEKEGMLFALLGMTFMLFYSSCLIAAPRLAMDRFKALTRGLNKVLVAVSVAAPSSTAGLTHIELQGHGDPRAVEAALDARMVWLLAVIKLQLVKHKVDLVGFCVSWTESPGARRIAVTHPERLTFKHLGDALTDESPAGSCPDEETQRYLTKNCVAARWNGDKVHPLLAGLGIVTNQTFWQVDICNALFGLTCAQLPSLNSSSLQAAVGASAAASMLLFQLTHPFTNPRRQWDALITFGAIESAFCIILLISVRAKSTNTLSNLLLSLCLLAPLAWSCLTLAMVLIRRMRIQDVAFWIEHELALLRYWRTGPEDRAAMRTRVPVDCIQVTSADAGVANLRAACWDASPPDPEPTGLRPARLAPLLVRLRQLSFQLGSRTHCTGWRCSCPDKVELSAGVPVTVLRRSTPLCEVRVEEDGGDVSGWVHEGALEEARKEKRVAPGSRDAKPEAETAMEVELVKAADPWT